MTDMTEEQEVEVTELEVLKQRADSMGITYPKNVTLATLKAKVNEALEDKAPEQVSSGGTKSRAQHREEALKLVRIRITCMNPHKRELEGEIFTVGNSMVGTVTKYVPFDTEDGWHVPQIILNMIQERQVMLLVTAGKTKQKKLVKEFNVEILPPLTKKEIEELARRQALARGQS